MFGNYRRDKYTENEGMDTDIGIDLLLSTMMPLSPVISSQSATSGPITSLSSSMFFNGEASVFMSFAYNWEAFLTVGYYSYESRKLSPPISGDNGLPRYHMFDMSSTPAVLGVRYRFSDSDMVPYLGAGLGFSRVHRHVTYDSSTINQAQLQDEDFNTVITGEVVAGLEFYFAARAGIRLEASAYYMRLPSRTFIPLSTPDVNPYAYYGANPWFLRYASGVFILF